MKMIKMALLAGAAAAASAAAAQADDLDALKAQIETLNARVAAMETAPAVPAGYQLVAISEGDMQATPGLGFTARELAAYGSKSTVISVLPTADAPAGSTISWSGYARAGLVYAEGSEDQSFKVSKWVGTPGSWNDAGLDDVSKDTDTDDVDVLARGQLRVKASTDTSVGEVGVDIRLRGNFNGNGDADVFSDVAWGYWAMTPEVTFGGGYAGSLGNIGYGYDGACSCYYTDNADLGFNPGDTTQLRLAYGSGPFAMAIALEDASARLGADTFSAKDQGVNGDNLGVAGEIKYSGDMFSGEISGVWRQVDEQTLADYEEFDTVTSLWQVGVGVGFALGDMANFSIAAALGEGPAIAVDEGTITDAWPYNQSYWGVTALASFDVSDEIHMELGAGYKNRQGDGFDALDKGVDAAVTTDDIRWKSNGADYDTYGVMGGVYYQPVDQLTVGIEAEWYTTETSWDAVKTVGGVNDTKVEYSRDTDNMSVDLVSVWRF